MLSNVGLSFSKKNCFIYFNESPLKMMKNAFYFMLKDLFIPKVLFEKLRNLCLNFFKVNFKNITILSTNNYNTRTAQHLTK